MKKEQIFLNDIEIIEWYDGIVRGIGKNDSKIYLIVLTQWNTQNSKKEYAFLELDNVTNFDLITWFDNQEEKNKTEKWSKFNSIFDKFIRRYRKKALLSSTYPIVNQPIRVNVLKDESYLGRLLNYSLENQITSEI